jgi:hypothetical protein
LNQGFELARQVLCLLSHNFCAFCSSYFVDNVSSFAQVNLICDPPIFMLSAVAEMTGVYHHTQLFPIEMGSCELFCLGWPETTFFFSFFLFFLVGLGSELRTELAKQALYSVT